jgi:hypothetical protein
MAIDATLFKKVPALKDRRQIFEIINRREELYKNMSASDMQEALSRLGIPITKAEILKLFKTNYSSEETIQTLFERYPKAAEPLDQRGLYINSDIVIEMVDRTLTEEYGATHIPDPGMIGDFLDDICMEDGDYSFKDIIAITESMNKLKEHYSQRNLDVLFSEAIGLDTIEQLVDIIVSLGDQEHTPQESLDLLEQVNTLIQNYQFEKKEDLLKAALTLAIKDNPDQKETLTKALNENKH